ncbi:hypothetical protein [Nostoc sp. CALU 546]|uniref:hypothetical protein n=1 Tax=Nostoc sp. CALU 546 TaxID=1867241 RepID=UPI003B66EAD7
MSDFKMPMVEVWLGLLLGRFTLEQRGNFYYNQNVWVNSSLTWHHRGRVAGLYRYNPATRPR